MTDREKVLSAILDSLTEEVVFTDMEHIVRYMNPAGIKHYGDVTGKSIFACHNERSQEIIKNILSRLQSGAAEILYKEDENRRIYMRAVRDKAGKVIGYYERYETKAGKLK